MTKIKKKYVRRAGQNRAQDVVTDPQCHSATFQHRPHSTGKVASTQLQFPTLREGEYTIVNRDYREVSFEEWRQHLERLKSSK